MEDTVPFKYDVALSFLQADEALAQSLSEALKETCAVFLYSERQRELAGKDGVDEFTAVFRDQSRVCVVLYREGWGSTKWTRVEETAIKDRAFEGGWEFLTVVAVGPGAPKWLPKTKLWLGLDRFGVPGAVAVIEARVREQGGEAKPETARGRAERLTRIAAAQAARGNFLNSESGVAVARSEFQVLRDYMKTEVDAMLSQQPPVDIVFDERHNDTVMGVSCSRAALTFGWSLQYSNTLRHSSLLVQEFDRAYRLGGYRNSTREPLNAETWLFTTTLEGAPAWHETDSPEKLFSTQALAEHFLTRLLDRAHEPRVPDSSEW